ncbi:hypothetical protein PR003_g4056 [Phytophthora rubi]|uniref:Uncharacterized protein n=1 Tax=Phytophthora rubi TaxID=129364 RepID=A0A6A4G6V0_9STRA|nr:hypothetical protein PR002_g5083 [Phytophthora rubi]KAE9353094.1 hypothetical protein PR003_g4056 [Phytophthora rubi]
MVFSERFAARLHEMDDNPSRHTLDIGAVNAYNRFWQDVEISIASSNVEYDLLVLDRPQYEGIKPHSAPPQNAEKLRELWCTSTGNYTTALTNSRQSRTHTSDFFDFCGGKRDELWGDAG